MIRKTLFFLTKNPYIDLLVGIGLIYCGVQEVWEDLAKEAEEFSPGAHHGVIMYGLFHALRSLGDILDGVDRLKESSRKKSTL